MNKLLSLLFIVGLLILFVGCNTQDEPSITIENDNITLEIAEEITITPVVSKEYFLVWSSSNQNIATVDNGKITGLALGIAYISVQIVESNIKKTITVNVVAKSIPTLEIIGPNKIVVGDEISYQTNIVLDQVIWKSNDSTIATMSEEGVLVALQVGQVSITAECEGYHSGIITIDVGLEEVSEMTITGKTKVAVGEHVTYEISLLPISATGRIIWSTSNECLASMNNLGEAVFYDAGEVIFTATLEENEEIVSSITVEIYYANIEEQIFLVDDDFSSLSENESIFYEQKLYQYQKNAFASIQEAINAVLEPSQIFVLEGLYEESIHISKSDITIIGPNQDVDLSIDSRVSEAVINAPIQMDAQVNNMTFNGLAFTKSATIIGAGSHNHFVFTNNYVYETNVVLTPWVEDASYTTGFITIKDLPTYSDQILISHNLFSQLGDVAINYSNVNNLKVLGNTFVDFTKDAIRSTKGIVNKTSQWLFKDNAFKNSPYNALFFRTYGSSAGNVESMVSIFDNHFENLGSNEQLFVGAISFRNFQEGFTYVNISYNSFVNCTNYIMLRNNAITANQSNFVGFINYNQFVGTPKKYYLNNKNTMDTVSTNPNNINMDYNFYGNALGFSLNLSEYASFFNGSSSLANPLSLVNEYLNYPRIYASNVIRLDTSPKLISTEGTVWLSSNDAVVQVDQTGTVKPNALGQTTIRASKGGYETSFFVKVLPSLNIDYIKRILEIAIGQEGYVEGPNNDTKYGTWYGMPNQPWCAMFVSWSANQAKISTTIIPKYASVSLGMAWFQDRQLFQYKGTYVPKAGDIIFFKSDGASHTGLVISSDGVKVYTIEGNTSDKVAKRNYDLNYRTITGYGTPNYPTYEGEPFVFDISDSTDGSGANTR